MSRLPCQARKAEEQGSEARGLVPRNAVQIGVSICVSMAVYLSLWQRLAHRRRLKRQNEDAGRQQYYSSPAAFMHGPMLREGRAEAARP